MKSALLMLVPRKRAADGRRAELPPNPERKPLTTGGRLYLLLKLLPNAQRGEGGSPVRDVHGFLGTAQ